MISIPLEYILFLDIETVSQHESRLNLKPEMQELWDKKHEILASRGSFDATATPEDSYRNSAAIYAEFGKIAVISVGFFYVKEGTCRFRVKSFTSDNERLLLEEFMTLVKRFFVTREHTFCGHNIKEFDIPYICRRMLVNGLTLPSELSLYGKKPWEINFIDTLEMWRFGDFKNYTALKLLTAIFNIPSPKDDIDGSEVGRVYYEQKDLARIARYCEKDVVATAQLFLKLTGRDIISDEVIEHV